MNELATLKQIYSSAKLRNDDIGGLTKALSSWYLSQPAQHNFLHPCLINGKPALVCQAGLSSTAASAFTALQLIADQYGIYLKEDSRQHDDATFRHNRRRDVSLVLSFCIGMMATSRVVSANDLPLTANAQSVASQLAEPTQPMQAAMSFGKDGSRTIRLRQSRPPTAEQVLAAYSQKQATLKHDQIAASTIADFLTTLYQANAGDPNTINADLAVIADYYSQFPHVIGLINELRGQKLVMTYRPDTWQAQAWGNRYGVDSVTIYFDTRLGAQLLNNPGCEDSPACSISPADALLHELLHAKLMLLDSEHFIAGGGMEPNLYPFAHEQEVINKENQLYAQMNQLDGRARPLRHRHSGELLHVTCPACTPVKHVASSE